MLDTLLNMLEKYNVPTDIIDMIKEKLGGELNIDTVKEIFNENKDRIPNVEELTSKLDGMEGMSGIADKAGDAKGMFDKAKGMLGM